jgi:urease accessory protein
VLRFTEIVAGPGFERSGGVLTMSFADRRRSRLRTRLDDGREIALQLPRGSILRDGDRLRAEDGDLVIAVRAAEENLSRVQSDDQLRLARAAYHLGNRHVPVQIGPGFLAYEHDHVLDGMVEDLGLHAEPASAPFEPEAGGYRHGEARAQEREHTHGHDHDHDHDHHPGDHRHGH